jgi:hypothetical protein
MKKETNNSKLGIRMLIGTFISVAFLAILALSLNGTPYIKIVPYLGGIIWVVLLLFSGKYFINLLKHLFNK